MRPEGWQIVVIIVLAIVLFGAPKLPGIARSVGQSLRIFKSEVKQMKDENEPEVSGTSNSAGLHTSSEPQEPHASNPALNQPILGTTNHPNQHPTAGQKENGTPFTSR
ncbi:Sec-independent protein translocase subunit TatA [Arthrobacter zhaoguopingii]|uniref:Sec-independent protein translocase subunit TatA n=1 Tax=Arthrobacter zhaoguopingii TaxID=2681491 RepID=UPI001358877A|nr:Sec-independent protein translocase subunit TatA [Arthrobacter zhaoguopingii]